MVLNLRALGVGDALTRQPGGATWCESDAANDHPAQRLPLPESILRPGGRGP